MGKKKRLNSSEANSIKGKNEAVEEVGTSGVPIDLETSWSESNPTIVSQPSEKDEKKSS